MQTGTQRLCPDGSGAGSSGDAGSGGASGDCDNGVLVPDEEATTNLTIQLDPPDQLIVSDYIHIDVATYPANYSCLGGLSVL